jgi:hypothetical protein
VVGDGSGEAVGSPPELGVGGRSVERVGGSSRLPPTRSLTAVAALPTVRATEDVESSTVAGSSGLGSGSVCPSGRNWNFVPPQAGQPESISFEPSSNCRPQSVHWCGIGLFS